MSCQQKLFLVQNNYLEDRFLPNCVSVANVVGCFVYTFEYFYFAMIMKHAMCMIWK